MRFTFRSRGGKKTDEFLEYVSKEENLFRNLTALGKRGVEALRANTPVDTGLTASAWSFELEISGRTSSITWLNSSVTRDGTPIAIMLQYGHGTGTGGYVRGIDYINPAMAPIFDKIADDVWKVVTSA